MKCIKLSLKIYEQTEFEGTLNAYYRFLPPTPQENNWKEHRKKRQRIRNDTKIWSSIFRMRFV